MLLPPATCKSRPLADSVTITQAAFLYPDKKTPTEVSCTFPKKGRSPAGLLPEDIDSESGELKQICNKT